MSRRFAPAVTCAMCVMQSFTISILFTFAQPVDAQNSRVPVSEDISELRGTPEGLLVQQMAPQAPSSRTAAGTVSVAAPRHRVPKEALKAYERSLKTARKGRIPDVEAAAGVEAAAVDLERAIGIDPDFPEAHGRLGFLYFRLTRFQQAATELRRAIALNPEFARWHSDLGWTLFGLGDDVSAQQCARRALALEPENASARLLLGVLLAASAESRLESLWNLVEGADSLQRAR